MDNKNKDTNQAAKQQTPSASQPEKVANPQPAAAPASSEHKGAAQPANANPATDSAEPKS